MSRGRLDRSAPLFAIAGGWFVAGVLAARRGRERTALRRAEDEATAARERASMLEQVGDTVRDLISSPRTREEVCLAATELAGARAAIIYELRDGLLTCTAAAGLRFPGGETVASGETVVDPASRAQRAFDVARPVFLAGAREDRVASVALWRAGGSPASVLYQPMVCGGRTVGVLAAGWRDVVPFDGAECATVALLAHEAAAVIDHADAVDSLTGLSRTDPLTGLANRRAFDAALARGLDGAGSPAVVLLDVDRLIDYNERFGHRAGDRLLKAVVAKWQAALREGDTLARVAGERFALVLPDCDAAAAVSIAQRLREVVPGGQTCSAGVVVRRAGESAGGLVRRGERALGEAKAAGGGMRCGEPMVG